MGQQRRSFVPQPSALILRTLQCYFSKQYQMIHMKAQFVCVLEIVGVGYKANTNTQGTLLCLKLGFSHDVILQVPPLVRVFCLKPTLICCTGTTFQNVMQFAATIRSCKPPEVYKGKGIRYRNETIVQKQGKKK
jgi:large subunit ribosomal protein L6